MVERELSVLADKSEPGRQIVQMNIISQDGLTSNRSNSKVLETNSNAVNLQSVDVISQNISDNATTPSRVASPTGLSDIVHGAVTTHGDSKMGTSNEDEEINGGVSNFTGTCARAINRVPGVGCGDFAGFLSQNVPDITPSASPLRFLKENENQWLDSEIGDYSFTSLLGHLELPMKSNPVNVNLVEGLPPEEVRSTRVIARVDT